MTHYELRSNPQQIIPPFVVTEVHDDGTGEDVAAFWGLVKALEYRESQNEKEKYQHQIRHSRHD